MFKPTADPRIFACPPGADFSKQLVAGLIDRMSSQPPEAMSKVELFVNTRRMDRRIRDLFDQGPALFLPRIRLITDIVSDPIGIDIPTAASKLRRKLELGQLISGLIDRQPDLAPRSAIFDLADSLALLMGEMQDEGITPEAIKDLEISDRSGHWQRNLMFLEIVDAFFGAGSSEPPDIATRQRLVTERLVEHWQGSPPNHPVIVAGSTGSRGTTALLMHAVAKLPQGAIILPGFDFELPAQVWDALSEDPLAEGHPQYRFAQLMTALNQSPSDIQPWRMKQTAPNIPRNRLVSLALRPAPVTDQWMREGPSFDGVTTACENISLIEAPSPREESVAIALILRKAAEDGKTAALVTPDQMLTRRVTSALDRWRIIPDTSAGKPLSQSAPGRLFRHVSELFGQPLTSESLLVLLKHPLVNSDPDLRGPHLIWTRDLELHLRRYGPPFPSKDDLLNWASRVEADDGRVEWAGWIADMLCPLAHVTNNTVEANLNLLLETTFTLVRGLGGTGHDQLWDLESGKETQKALTELAKEAQFGGVLSTADFRQLIFSILKSVDVRDPVQSHPKIMIWGTLEARVQGADLIILGGLNENVWPDMPSPDPWLNREMRVKTGLLLPERRTGLAAHDFQQVVAAKEIVLSRAVRDAEAETVASRWLNRLTNLLGGMSDESRKTLAEIKARGDRWVDLGRALETPKVPVAAAKRPSPRPPAAARPRSLSVTAISRLIRDPYAIYASGVLRLRKLDRLRQLPDAPLRGTVLHSVLEEFIKNADTKLSLPALKEQLMRCTDQVLEEHAPWPAARVLWRAKLERVADVFLADEVRRQSYGSPIALEIGGGLRFPEIDFTLSGKADRIDRSSDGRLIIYDYKTGSIPTKKQLKHFDKQLMLEALMAEAGAFRDLEAAHVSSVAHIGLGSSPKFAPVELEADELRLVYKNFGELITHYLRPDSGFTSRRAMAGWRIGGDFDHLARFGEWDETQEPAPEDVV